MQDPLTSLYWLALLYPMECMLASDDPEASAAEISIFRQLDVKDLSEAEAALRRERLTEDEIRSRRWTTIIAINSDRLSDKELDEACVWFSALTALLPENDLTEEEVEGIMNDAEIDAMFRRTCRDKTPPTSVH